MKKLFFLLLALMPNLMGLTFDSSPLQGQPIISPTFPTTWSIIASYTLPGKASGLAWDGTYIYFGQYWTTSGQVYKFNPATGISTLQCTGPFEEAFGMTYKSPDLVTVHQPSSSSQPSEALEFTLAGSQVSTITLPDHYMSGIAYDNGTYWVCTYSDDPGKIYHINASGSVISQFVPPNTQPWDICLQGSDLWIADYYGNMLYKVTSTGTLLESHPSQGTAPSGIVFDGTYLWYCDGQLGSNSTLYKIDLQGSGTPVISLPVTSHNYGVVTIGDSPSWTCEVRNTGSADLVINSISIPPDQQITTSFTTPATITPGGSVNIPFIYSPTTTGHLNTQVTIHSSDPIHAETLVSLTGDAVFPGPHITITETSYNWNVRRSGSYSRLFLPVTNSGSQPLTITALDLTDSHFSIDEGVILPLSVSTLETKNIGIWFHPTAGTPFSGTLSITSNDTGQNPFLVTLSGTGVNTLYPMGTVLWNFNITGGFDDSPKAIRPIQDITGDNVDDVIIASEDYNIRCLNGNSSGEADVLWKTTINAGYVYQQNGMSIIDDIDNDGYKDVVIGTTGGDESITAFSGKNGTQIWRHDTHEYGNGGWVYQVDAVYDYNNDGFPDVLASTGDDGNGTGPKRVYCLNGKTGISIWETPTGGAVFSVIGAEDFNGDGKPDVVAGSTTGDETHGRVFGIDGTNGVILWTFIPAGSSTWGLKQLDDINGDGNKDIVSGDFGGNIYFHDATNGSQLEHTIIPGALILRFEDMGDINKDGYRDILVGHSGTNGIILNGHNISTIWTKPLADKSWNVANIGDVTWDGVNDAAIGTLYSNNEAYFLDGTNGNFLQTYIIGEPVDALSGIPDIAGDQSMELVVGGREGTIVCLSGGYDSATISVPGKKGLLQDAVRVYPNPCKGLLNVAMEITKSSEVNISVTDITGRASFTKRISNVQPGSHVIQLKRSEMMNESTTRGIFIIGIETNEGEYHFRVVME
jgi:hypothetical protein